MRYYLSQDQSCHWYLIPTDKRKEWREFNNLTEDDPKSWNPPEWAVMLGGSYEDVTFENPIVE